MRWEITISKVTANANGERTRGLTLTGVERRKGGDDITDPTEERNRELFRTGVANHEQAKCETRDLCASR